MLWTDAATGSVEGSSGTAGLAWSQPVVIAQGAAKSSMAPAVAVANGSLFAVYKGKTNDNLYYSISSGGAWSKQAQMNGGVTPYAPSIVFPPSSLALVVAWTTKSRQMERAYLSIFGPRPPVKIPGHTNAGPTLAILGSRLYIAWKGIKPNDVFYSSASLLPTIGTWTPERTIPESTTNVNPSLTSGGATLYAAWTNSRSARPLFSASDQPQLP
jgi:hypothetical protein